MTDTWATAFTAAVGLSLLGMPLLRRAAVVTGFFDRPAERKSHTVPTPYLGGIAIILASLGGVTIGGETGTELGVVAVAGAAIGLIGLLDDDRTLRPGPRLAVQLAAAVGAVAVGVRAEVSGTAAVDVAVTIVWIVGITNALNLLDNMDGLAGGVALGAAAGVFGLAAAAEQEIVATATAGVAGACLGFLAYNVRPASIYMGDAGALFLGYVLAIAALEVDVEIDKPASFLIPLLLLALPVLDTSTVTVARLRHGRPVAQGGTDHLSHRLVARGMSPGAAVAVLIAAEAALAAVAFAAGRDILPLVAAGAAALVVLGGVAAAAWPVEVYDTPRTGLSTAARLVGIAALGAGALAVGPPLVALVLAKGPLDEAADRAEAALAAARAGETDRAAQLFASSQRSFRTARDRLNLPLSSAGLGLPVMASNLRAARSIADVGVDVTAAGGRLASRTDRDRLRVVDGTIPLDAVRDLAPELARAEHALRDALGDTRAIEGVALLGPVRDAVADLEERLARAVDDTSRAAHTARLAPAIFGGDQPRRYFLAIQNNAELRATGGFIGNFAEVSAEGGRMHLGEVRRIAELNAAVGPPRQLKAPKEYLRRYGRFDVANTWQNVNMSPDFETVGSVIANLYPQSGGQPLDGVIAVDPPGLAAVLELTGPVTVPEWPEPITAANVVDITLNQAYEHFSDIGQRADFLGVVAGAAWQALIAGDLGDPADVARALGEAVEQRHLQVWLQPSKEQELVDRLGLGGEVAPVRSDSLMLVNQNAAGNKTDRYLDRTIEYDIRLDPSGDRAALTGELRVGFTNRAPTSGLNPEVIGPYNPSFQPGENRTFLSLYTPHHFSSASLDGKPTTLESDVELGRRVHSTFLSLGAGSTHHLALQLDGQVRLGPGGWYAVDVVHQPLLNPDRVAVSVEVADGWRVADVVGLKATGPNTAAGTTTVSEDVTLWVRVTRG